LSQSRAVWFLDVHVFAALKLSYPKPAAARAAIQRKVQVLAWGDSLKVTKSSNLEVKTLKRFAPTE
jgi:hypothetical protein